MKKKILLGFIAIIMCCSGSMYSFAASVSDLEDKKDDITDAKKDAQKDLDNVKNEKKTTAEKISDLNDQILNSQTQLDNLNAQIKTLEGTISTLEVEIQEAQKRYDEQQAAFEKRVVAQYKTGKTTYLDVLLNSSSLTNFLSNYFLVGKIAKADKQLLESINEEKTKIETKKQELEVQQAEVKTAKADVQKENVKLKNNKEEKNKQMANLSASEKELQNKIEEYLKQEADLDAQIKAAEKNNGGNGGQYTGGQFLWPCPASKRITSYFGAREQPVAGASTYHQGIDIGAPYASDIVAAASGTVVTATYSKSAGNYVMISHGSNLYTVYMHSSKLLVSVGQKVERGQVIAKVGSTGYSTGNHLHFGVRKNGTYVNPLGYLQ